MSSKSDQLEVGGSVERSIWNNITITNRNECNCYHPHRVQNICMLIGIQRTGKNIKEFRVTLRITY